MLMKSVKYGKSRKLPDGGMEHMEVFVALGPADDPDKAFEDAKTFVHEKLMGTPYGEKVGES